MNDRTLVKLRCSKEVLDIWTVSWTRKSPCSFSILRSELQQLKQRPKNRLISSDCGSFAVLRLTQGPDGVKMLEIRFTWLQEIGAGKVHGWQESIRLPYDSNTFGIHDIDLTIQEGEFIVLTGKSGCGKTTLTRCINGLIPDFFEGTITGSCRVCGMDISEHETGDYSSYVGSVFQDPRSQFFTLHVKTEIPFPSENLGTPSPVIQDRFRNTVKQLNISNLLKKSIFELSSGEKQKVAIASIYTANVQIYVLDEPSANLDWEGTKQLKKLLGQLKEQGCTIIISEHKLYYLKDLADRVVILKDGQINTILSGNEFKAQSTNWFHDNGLRQVNLKDIVCNPASVKAATREQVSVRAENLSFGYQSKQLLWKDVSFECQSGDIVGIVGKNGTGKSSLIRVLMGLEKPKSGKISIAGKYASKQQRRHKSFYVMQDVDYQFFAGSVISEMVTGFEKNPTAYERAREILRKFSLEGYENVHPSTLSGGQKQRLSIALSCMSDAPFLYFDEPTSGLDAENMKLVSETITEQAAAGKIAFVITHDYEFAASLFTSLLVVQDDHSIKRISPDEYRSETLSKIFELEE